ncbi:MAG TPA: MotA/TolQ/ExbB proton channel family protein [Longimicrobium sp.]|jgi:biopolymer transport protein TolQ|nr:MotA/TolQ/ExbB proton channel family protein [Longimicrobium sp.]
MLIQAHSGEFGNVWRMIAGGTLSTKLIMLTLAIFSLVSWGIIVLKLIQFRRLRRESDQFVERLERADRLDDAYSSIMALPESSFTRVFKRGMTFYSELRPARPGGEVRGLLPTQLEVLRLVLEKEEADERDALTKGLYWLAIFASSAPLLGLLGTVLGVMNSFIGVAEAGSSNITAVAPGIAEALVATAGGLVVAIPAAIGYNYLTGRLNLFMGELEGFSSEFIGALAREGRI